MMQTDNPTQRSTSAEQKEQAIATLRRLITPYETTVYILLRHRSRSGNETIAFVRATPQQTIVRMTVSIAVALDLTYDQAQEGIVLRRNRDVGAILEALSRLLFGKSGGILVDWI